MKNSLLIIIILLNTVMLKSANSKELRIAISSAPSNLSPFFSTDGNSQNILRLVHSSLIDFDKKMQPSCRLCIHYTEWQKHGKHHIKFKLKKKILFFDGTFVTAKDIKKSWKYFTDTKKIKSIFRFAFSNIEDVIIHSPHDVELIYKKFDLSNITNLALFKIIKIKDYNNKEKIKIEDLISCGEYRFYLTDELKITLIHNKLKSKKISFIVVKDETTLALKLMGGEIDLSLANISPRKLEWLKVVQKKELLFTQTAGSNYKYLAINHKKKYLNNKDIRKALSLLIPREEIIKYKLISTAIKSTGLFSKAFSDYYRDEIVDKNKRSIEKLFNKNGFTKNKEGFYQKDSKEIEFTIRTSSNKSAVEIATIISHFYNKAGVKSSVVTSEWGSFMKALKSGRFDMVLGQWIGFAGPEMLKSIFHSKSIPPKGLNRGHFFNLQFDKYIDLSVNSMNKEKRIKYYHEAMNIVDDEIPYISLWHPNIIWISRKCIKYDGVYPNGSFLPLLKIENECDKSENL